MASERSIQRPIFVSQEHAPIQQHTCKWTMLITQLRLSVKSCLFADRILVPRQNKKKSKRFPVNICIDEN